MNNINAKSPVRGLSFWYNKYFPLLPEGVGVINSQQCQYFPDDMSNKGREKVSGCEIHIYVSAAVNALDSVFFVYAML